jgi:hypothetical protein
VSGVRNFPVSSGKLKAGARSPGCKFLDFLDLATIVIGIINNSKIKLDL